MERTELDDLAVGLRKLWVDGDAPAFFNPGADANHALAVAQRVTEWLDANEYDAHQFRLTYLELLQCDAETWAATFSQSTWSDPEWYEARNWSNHPHTARADSPQLAICRAALSLVELFNRK